jgi:ATP-dependent helicase/nuclease subunit B
MATHVTQQLYGTLEEARLEKKLLVTKSYAVGRQWVERISREFGPVLNVDVETVEGLALKRAKKALDASGLTYVSSEETYWIVYALLRKSATSDPVGSYVPEGMITPGVVECFHEAICELREAGIAPEQLSLEAFEPSLKGVYVRELYVAYTTELATQRLLDFAGLVTLAASAAEEAFALILVDDSLRLTVGAEWMLRCASGGKLAGAGTGIPFTNPASGFPYAETKWFHALGPLAEVSEVARRMAASGHAWDQAECLLSDYGTYAPIMHSLSVRFGIPCTFAGGLPIRASVLGRAALIYMDWLESGFRADVLVSIFKLGAIQPPDDTEIRIGEAIRLLETSGIGWGRERYAWLSRDDSGREQDRKTVQWLNALCSRWLEVLPADGLWSPENVVVGLSDFLSCCRAPSSRGDADVWTNIKALRNCLTAWGKDAIRSHEAIRAVRNRLERLTVEAVGIPEPGKLHVASVDNGGRSGRPDTYVLGMSEMNWTAAIRQNPVLLDAERTKISSGLETSGQRALRQQEARSRRFGGLRGKCTVSYSSIRLSDHSEASPAYELLQLYRIASERPEADFESLIAEMGGPVGIFGIRPLSLPISLDESVLHHLVSSNQRIRDGREAVLQAYAPLRNGVEAVLARSQEMLGPYDGVLRPSLHEAGFMPGHLSASKLETYAKCPLLFFYQEVLGLRAKETVEFNRTRWLDALQRGQLLHEIFFTYMSETSTSKGDHDRDRLDACCERKLRETEARIPAPSPHVFEKECESIRSDVEVFWRMEAARSSKPAWFELELHNDLEPFLLELAEDFSIPIKGFVDRVDEVAAHQYKIIDYKTGNPKYYEDGSFFAGGTQLQHALYALATEQWLQRQGGDPEASVLLAAYAFPTVRGLGEEVIRPQTGRRRETAALLRNVVEAMQSGLFPPTDRPQLCQRCDYAAVCGSHAEWKKNTRTLPENRERLTPLLEVNASV